MYITIGIIVVVFVVVMVIVMSAASPASNKNLLTERMNYIAQLNVDGNAQAPPSLVEAELGIGFHLRVLRPALQNLGTLALRISPGGANEQLRLNLTRAGNPGGMDVLEFNGIRLASVALFFFGGIMGQGYIGPDPLNKIIVFGLCIVVGMVLPDGILQRVIAARQDKIRRSLPNIIDLLVVSVEAGMGFDGAVQKVVDKVRGPLADEFARSLYEMRLGKTRAKSLKDMASRIGVAEVSSFVAAIYQSEMLGVSIANVLRIQSQTIRVQHAQRIREDAAKLPVKMLFPLVFFIFPAIFVVLLGPAYISIRDVFIHMQ